MPERIKVSLRSRTVAMSARVPGSSVCVGWLGAVEVIVAEVELVDESVADVTVVETDVEVCDKEVDPETSVLDAAVDDTADVSVESDAVVDAEAVRDEVKESGTEVVPDRLELPDGIAMSVPDAVIAELVAATVFPTSMAAPDVP